MAYADPAEEHVSSPFTDEQVVKLNEYQTFQKFHPYTCGNDSTHKPLVATNNGWVCLDCDYTQDWAHRMTLDWNWKIG